MMDSQSKSYYMSVLPAVEKGVHGKNMCTLIDIPDNFDACNYVSEGPSKGSHNGRFCKAKMAIDGMQTLERMSRDE
jgi:hypothetical protein